MDFLPSNKENFFSYLTAWAQEQDKVRAVVITSTFATINGPVDRFSDYDVILIVTDIHSFTDDHGWMETMFGRILAVYEDPMVYEDGFLKCTNVTQFVSGLKIDFTFWSPGILEQVASTSTLPKELDAGYLVLLDKDGLASKLKPPTYHGYIPFPPTKDQYCKRIEMCILNACYVAKYLWRGDIMAAKHVLEAFLMQEDLLPMLEWLGEIDHDWTISPGPYGRRLQNWLRPDLWQELLASYTGGDLDDNWAALWHTIDLMRRVSQEVGARLGYEYPVELDRLGMAYLKQVQNTPRE